MPEPTWIVLVESIRKTRQSKRFLDP